MLPCFWLYQHIGELLAGRCGTAARADAHPYAAWIDTYADPAFAELTATAIAFTDRAAAHGVRRRSATPWRRRSSGPAGTSGCSSTQGTDMPGWPV